MFFSFIVSGDSPKLVTSLIQGRASCEMLQMYHIAHLIGCPLNLRIYISTKILCKSSKKLTQVQVHLHVFLSLAFFSSTNVNWLQAT